jgi:hypothetical protein
MTQTFYRRFLTFTTGFCCLSAVACMSPRYEPIPDTGASLTGTVTYKKQKLTGGLITVAGDTPGSSSEIKPDGTYTVNSVPVGNVIIGVNTAMAKAKAAGMRSAPKDVQPPPVVDIPAKYASPGSSGIKTEIKPGPNTFDIVIE